MPWIFDNIDLSLLPILRETLKISYGKLRWQINRMKLQQFLHYSNY